MIVADVTLPFPPLRKSDRCGNTERAVLRRCWSAQRNAMHNFCTYNDHGVGEEVEGTRIVRNRRVGKVGREDSSEVSGTVRK